MTAYHQMSRQELEKEKSLLDAAYAAFQAKNLKLNMARGKPSVEQSDLSNGMFNCLSSTDYFSEDGVDCRNYGTLDGIPEMKRIFADLLHLSPDEIIVGGNSSLAMMFDNVSSNMSHGVRDGIPWSKQGEVKFLCPSPGYDRHFGICEYFHIQMIPVAMTETGPDMDEVERLVSSDPMIKGIWCVPKYSNPDGIVYSDETVLRMANLKPAASDFRIYWDDAYAIHYLYDKPATILNILRECEKAGNPNMPLIFSSFSKISFAGAGVACIAASRSNIEFIKQRMAMQTIGHDKLNQLRHARFFKDAQGVLDHMAKHAAILRPKFEAVEEALERELAPLQLAHWQNPKGGYFISVYVPEGCAKRVVQLCKEAGVVLTGAGATYPYGNVPHDSNIRVAPSYPSVEELRTAAELFCLCVKLAAAEKILSE